jgi:hypothetical protein
MRLNLDLNLAGVGRGCDGGFGCEVLSVLSARLGESLG